MIFYFQIEKNLVELDKELFIVQIYWLGSEQELQVQQVQVGE